MTEQQNFDFWEGFAAVSIVSALMALALTLAPVFAQAQGGIR